MEQSRKSFKTEFYIPSSDGMSRLHGIHWMCAGQARAVLQISHGMLEHIGRYQDFAAYLNALGIAVVGQDHLGHGKTTRPERHGIFANERGAYYVMEDIKRVSDYVKRQYPRLPHFMLGHSMGSFFLRRYLTLYQERYSGVVLSGTGEQPGVVLKAGSILVKKAVKKTGRESYTEELHRLVLGGYGKLFKPAKTEHDWLSRDERQARRYEVDPDCQFIFSNGAYEDFFEVMTALKQKKQFDNLSQELPVLIISGAKDPVGEQGAGVRRVYKGLKKQGLSDVTMKLYPDARHELLNEINRDEVFKDIVSWLNQHI